jgi:hypothetical protein
MRSIPSPAAVSDTSYAACRRPYARGITSPASRRLLLCQRCPAPRCLDLALRPLPCRRCLALPQPRFAPATLSEMPLAARCCLRDASRRAASASRRPSTTLRRSRHLSPRLPHAAARCADLDADERGRENEIRRKGKKIGKKGKMNYLIFKNCDSQFTLTILLSDNKNRR